jgi:hypothetical protein
MIALDHPYGGDGHWLRGNLHAHTTESDGRRDPELVVRDYAARGYDFLALTDHDVFTDPALYESDTGLVLLPGVEVSANGPHLLHLDASGPVSPDADRQRVVDAVGNDDGIAIPAHPNWQEAFAHWPQEELQRVTGYAGIEIFNGLIEHHPGAALATDRWDQLLAAGRQVWGFATDDSHRATEVGKGWIVVQAREREPKAILDAIAAGRFYASTGVSLQTIEVADGSITVETADADRIRLVSDHGVVQQTVDGPVATFRVPEQLVYREDHTYVRVECLGRGGDCAWLQPMFLS